VNPDYVVADALVRPTEQTGERSLACPDVGVLAYVVHANC